MESKSRAGKSKKGGMSDESSQYRNIKEEYKIQEQIGQGSYAHVRRAKHRKTGEHVAIKVVSKKRMNTDDLAAL